MKPADLILIAVVVAAGGAAVYMATRPKPLQFGASPSAQQPATVQPEPVAKPSGSSPKPMNLDVGQIINTGKQLYDFGSQLFGKGGLFG